MGCTSELQQTQRVKREVAKEKSVPRRGQNGQNRVHVLRSAEPDGLKGACWVGDMHVPTPYTPKKQKMRGLYRLRSVPSAWFAVFQTFIMTEAECWDTAGLAASTGSHLQAVRPGSGLLHSCQLRWCV